MDDHVDDGDGPFARRPVALAGARVAGTWSRAGSRTATGVGFDATDLLAVPARQREAEGSPTVTLATATAPTEAAVGSALAHTAVLAGRPGNVAPLDEAGRLLGRLAHLLDAVADLDDDATAGRWNPLAATGTSRAAALARCRDAVAGIRAALGRVSFAPDADEARQLAHRLLVHEAGRAVDRPGTGPPEPPLAPWDPSAPVGDPDRTCPTRTGPTSPSTRPPPHRPPRGLLGGCAAAAGLCCTGQLCCADEFVGPWSGQPRQGWCSSCTDGCSCGCDCCDCCSDCDGCCSCDCS